MKGTDRVVLLALPLLGLLAAFWLLVLSPKREEAAKLADDIEQLEASVAEQETLAATAEEARKRFPRDYRRLVALGKAVPADEDTPSLLVQLQRLSARAGVDFRALELIDTGAAQAPSAAPAAAPTTPATAAEESEQRVASAEAGTAPATEAAAATLPIGATVGPAGLPVMPYGLQFAGDFFGVASFIGQLDKMVGLRKGGRPSVFGRLVTVDGFTLRAPTDGSGVEATFAVTTYVTPLEQGPTGGATPAGPAPAEAQPASTGATTTAPPAASVGASLPTGGGE